MITSALSEHEFSQEVTFTHKSEIYSARDNGAIMRHARIDKPPRKLDNKWTFGNRNAITGYLDINAVRVHRVIAFAFLGEPPTNQHVVDHIDTNKCNNRPQNLRWVTKLENILLNPITSRRIEIVCGSVEAFLVDPSKFRDKFPDPNFKWMCSVNAEEANNSLQRMLQWAKSDNIPSGGTLGSWIFGRSTRNYHNVYNAECKSDLSDSKTANAMQRDWEVPCEFPCCPQIYSENPLYSYSENLQIGALFCKNNFYSSTILESVLSTNYESLYVVTESTQREAAIKRWALAKITFDDGVFIHMALGSFFTKTGVEKKLCLSQGLEWTGEDSIDDYC